MKAVVIGAGAMGAPAAQVLAERGHAVTLLDRFGLPNTQGGSGFGLRSFRLSHFERADVRFALRGLELFLDLERRTGRTLYTRRGILHAGTVVEPMARAFAAENVPYRELDAADARSIFPEFRPRPGQPLMFQPDGGVNHCVDLLLACCELATARGAEISPRERVIALTPLAAGGVRVFTDRRRLDADVAVVAVGPWTNELLEPIGLGLALEPGLAQVSYFRGAHGDDTDRPSLMERTGVSEDALYGLITPGIGYKIGFATVDRTRFFADLRARPLDMALEQALVRRVRRDFPGFHTGPLQTECGVITLTPDDRFVLDRRGDVVIGAGCMGHAFKFAPAIGEVLADLAEGRRPGPDYERFRSDRPGLTGGVERSERLAVQA
jgi:sarcosine oxidase